MRYTSRGLRRSRGTDKWDVTLRHRDPLSGELVSTYHTVEARTRKKAEPRARQFLKHSSPIRVTPSGIETLARLVQPAN